ncbi:MAG: hypothetical protein ACFFAY_06620 [Promethearchaeota archaeon]
MLSEKQTIEAVEPAKNKNTVKGILKILGLALIWAFIIAATVGSFAAAVWTLIPTELLEWGSTALNLLGYVSHCSFAPISSLILLSVAAVGVFLSYKLTSGRKIGFGVFIGTAGGLLIGLLGGIDIIMFIGMGAGVGIGVVLGVLIGILNRAEV